MTKLLLDIALVDFCRAGETGAQRMAGELRQAVFLGQIRPDARVQDRALDQPGDMLVVQSRFQCAFAIPRGADEDWTEVDLCEVQPLLKRMHGAGLILGPAANLDLAPASLGIEGEKGAIVEDLDPTARVRRVVLVNV